MKALILATLVLTVTSTVSSVTAVETPPSDTIDVEQALAAARLRNQDRMFSLMIAAYFEVQQEQIESDHDRRLKAMSGEDRDGLGLVVQTSLKMQKYLPVTLQTLAAQERDLRLARMARNITGLLELYQTTRSEEQKTIGMTVPNAVDIETATKYIRQLLASRMERPRDPRLWADQGVGPDLAAKPMNRKAAPTAEASMKKPQDIIPVVQREQPVPRPLGLVGATLFGFPMLRNPAFSVP